VVCRAWRTARASAAVGADSRGPSHADVIGFCGRRRRTSRMVFAVAEEWRGTPLAEWHARRPNMVGAADGGICSATAGTAVQAAHPASVPLDKTPRPLPGMHATELFTLRRITTRPGRITHLCYLRPGEELHLSHSRIIPPQ
jgi:hypothetical protein